METKTCFYIGAVIALFLTIKLYVFVLKTLTGKVRSMCQITECTKRPTLASPLIIIIITTPISIGIQKSDLITYWYITEYHINRKLTLESDSAIA